MQNESVFVCYILLYMPSTFIHFDKAPRGTSANRPEYREKLKLTYKMI